MPGGSTRRRPRNIADRWLLILRAGDVTLDIVPMRHSTRLRFTLLWACVIGAGCAHREGVNSDCRWPPEAAVESPDPRHLSADAEFAEDLAIRYADVHHGLRTPYFVSGEAYVAARDQCMQTLFAQIAGEHHVPVQVVSDALGRNRARVDAAENLPFALFYCFVAAVAAPLIWRRYPPAENGWMPGAIMALFLSLAFALGGTMLGEVWSWIVETHRIGNHHISRRVDRLWWVRHHTLVFAGAMIVFWLAAAQSARRKVSA